MLRFSLQCFPLTIERLTRKSVQIEMSLQIKNLLEVQHNYLFINTFISEIFKNFPTFKYDNFP